jgi:hypothetical protein
MYAESQPSQDRHSIEAKEVDMAAISWVVADSTDAAPGGRR